MNFKFKYIFGSLALLATLLSSCGSASSNKEEKEETKVSKSELEEAHIAGREAARVFVNSNWEDTLHLQEQLIIAGSKAAKYDSIPRMRAAFDSAFISTIKTVRPEIAAELEAYRKGNKK